MVKKYAKFFVINVAVCLVAYILAVLTVYGYLNVDILLEPYAYMSLYEFHLIKVITLTIGTLSVSASLLIPYAKKSGADILLLILSYFLPIVALILGIIYRVKQDKSLAISNTYLLALLASAISVLLSFIYYYSY